MIYILNLSLIKFSIALSHFFKLNLKALKLYSLSIYKYNIHLLFFIFICVICSIILRSNLVIIPTVDNITFYTILPLKGLKVFNYYNIFISFLAIFSTIYSLKLICDIIFRCVAAYKIIPELIKWSKSLNSTVPDLPQGKEGCVKDMKSIMSLYYLQNVFFILLSCWILYILLSKLNLFMDGIYLFIITLGIIGSIIFIHYYPPFYSDTAIDSQRNGRINSLMLNTAVKDYPIYIYLLFILFIIFYMFIFPLCVIKIINSDKFITYFSNNIYAYGSDKNIKDYFNYMDATTVPTVSQGDESTPDSSSDQGIVIRNNNLIKVAAVGGNVKITGNNKIEILGAPTVQNNTGNIFNHYGFTQVVMQNIEPTTSQGDSVNITSPVLQTGVTIPSVEAQSSNPLSLRHRSGVVQRGLDLYFKTHIDKLKSMVIAGKNTQPLTQSALSELDALNISNKTSPTIDKAITLTTGNTSSAVISLRPSEESRAIPSVLGIRGSTVNSPSALDSINSDNNPSLRIVRVFDTSPSLDPSSLLAQHPCGREVAKTHYLS